jgi:lysophospholipase L1-like esterase
MLSPPARMGLAAAVLVAGACVAVVATRGGDGEAAGGTAPAAPVRPWVDSWTSTPQAAEPDNLPPAPFTRDTVVFPDTTLRQTIRVSLGGQRIRLRISNVFGGAPLPVTAVSVAQPVGGRAGVSGIRAGTARPVTFGGRASMVVPVGAQIVSDPLDYPVAARANLTVTIYLAQGQASTSITSHPGSRTTSYLVPGDHLIDADLPGAVSVEHWYLLSGLEVSAGPGAAAVVTLGDSLTDGRGSTTDGNDRWPDQLFDRLQRDRSTDAVAVVNQATGGNRVLNDGLGPAALARLDRDVLARSGARWLVVFEGVNDIGTAGATTADQRRVADDLLAAYDQIITRAHAVGLLVYGATLTPFGGNTGYDDAQGTREAARQAVNHWIRTGHRFDAVIDFDRAVRDPADPRRLLPAADLGDHLHLNPNGHRLLADAVPGALFGR